MFSESFLNYYNFFVLYCEGAATISDIQTIFETQFRDDLNEQFLEPDAEIYEGNGGSLYFINNTWHNEYKVHIQIKHTGEEKYLFHLTIYQISSSNCLRFASPAEALCGL